ncbi:MAG TPA: FMN-binding negative transcriptional regulator [Allosphingosinicella sp.]|jgi:transcriptional regulator|nr:FMN-binding negative transcriptional regulator [Allosphingosinicella sp.]
MHPNRKFHIQDRGAMVALVRELGFGILFVSTPGGPRAVHVPVLIEGERLRFHVSRGNSVHAALLEGAKALFVATGPHAYISPEYYGLEDRVPTWNYVSVELEGPVRALGPADLIRLMDDLSAEQEARLAPKPPWTRSKMSEGRFEGLLKAITGFEMQVADWRGTAKVDQDKPQAVRGRIADALDERGETAMAAVMRIENPPRDFAGRGTARSAVEGPLIAGEPLHQASPGPPPRQMPGRN